MISRIWLSVGTGISPVGQVVDFSTALDFKSSKYYLFPQVTTTTFAGQLSHSRSTLISTVLEVDSSATLTATKYVNLGTVTTLDTALEVSYPVAGISPASTITSVNTFTAKKTLDISQVLEADTANSFTALYSSILNPAAELSTAYNFTSSKYSLLDTVVEASSVNTFSYSSGLTIGTSVETSSAQSFNTSKTLAILSALEIDLSQSFFTSKIAAIAPITETSTSLTFSALKYAEAGLATTVATAYPLLQTLTVPLNQVTSVSNALQFSYAGFNLDFAVKTLTLTPFITRTLTKG